MAFEIDVLITYSNEDNQSDTDRGWVQEFKHFLELMLVQVLGSKPNIMLKSEHDSITGGNLKKVAILVPVLSPSFVASGESLDTVESFYGTIKQSDTTRVFKILKRPVSIEEQPAKLKELIGYDLYDFDEDTGDIEDYKDFFSPEAERSFWMKMVDLAYDIHESLISLNELEKKGEVKHIYERRCIYLAETGHDLSIQRNIIKRELQRHGYKVLPDKTLPQDVDSLKKEIDKELEECSLSIHLIGSSYGDIPEGSDKSVVDLQNQIAAQRSASLKDKTKFSRLIWISNQLNQASEKQVAFIENIKRDLASSEGTEILQTALEDFKNIIREELIEVGIDKKLGKAGAIADNGKASIYLLHDKVDAKEVLPFKKHIEKAGYKVLLPAFEGDLLELRQQHINNLRAFDAAIIFQGNVNNQWVRMKLLDLLKAPGFGRRKPITGKAIISNREDKLDISAYKNYNVTVIDGDNKEALESLKGFLEEIKE
ncbi:DUF4062 domain-containing protein [Fulvivirga lutimaris]|uniref:DUF4062 domain-containing protein n=1 Tax=Fulvivirga lutimaris TaxID=1819566 RepID=UPI0012BCB39F|nr:DUF4062 domain-containing protein [Fulvivirga lutimaris]MTI40526.1 DUF4062 domain-containing protein [Fulvivirga lutimaris]